MAGGGEVVQYRVGAGVVARDDVAREEEDHGGGGEVVGRGRGGDVPADDALEVGAVEVPARAVGGPDLGRF